MQRPKPARVPGRMGGTAEIRCSLKVKSRNRFPLATLEAFVRERQLEGDVWDNITDVLDSIIDGRLAR